VFQCLYGTQLTNIAGIIKLIMLSLNVGSHGQDSTIPSMQSFWVNANNLGTQTLAMTNGVRSNNLGNTFTKKGNQIK